MDYKKITEQDSLYNDIEKKSINQIINEIHNEDFNAIKAIEKLIPIIEKVLKKIIIQLKSSGRLFYIGAGTSGRLGVLDASECPPTFGSKPEQVVGLIAGGHQAILKAVEYAEDNREMGAQDLIDLNFNSKDVLVGIAASGRTPYVIGAMEYAKSQNAMVASISCNPQCQWLHWQMKLSRQWVGQKL